MGQPWVDQEYECLFTAREGVVYPDFAKAVVPESFLHKGGTVPQGQRLGGIDFGWRNPFAAIWGVVDQDDVLWIVGERYMCQTPLTEHAAALPRDWRPNARHRATD